MRILMVLGVLLCALLAGCAQGADTISARDGLGPARDAARAHGADPLLASIWSIEPFSHMVGEDHEVWIHLDKDPGDGRAPAWFYTFASGDRLIGVAYAAGYGVMAEGYVDGEMAAELEPGRPLESWSLDSTDVAKALRATPDWPAPTADTTVFWSLEQADTGPVWHVEWENATHEVEASIDARTGEVVVGQRSRTTAFTCHGNSAQAMLLPTGGVSSKITIGPAASLDIAYSWSMVAGEAVMRLVGPEGEKDSARLTGSGSRSGSFGDLPPGTYTLSITTTAGAATNARVSLNACE